MSLMFSRTVKGGDVYTASVVPSRAKLVGILQALPDSETERLAPFVRQVDLPQGRQLIAKGEKIEYVWFPQSCVTSTIVSMPEGRTIEVGVMGYEGLVGLSLLFGSATSSTTAIVQISGTAACMRAQDFVEQIVRPRSEAYDSLLRYSDVFFSILAQTAACNGLHTVEQRLARLILMTHDRMQRDDMPLTQEFISYMFGVRRASVSIAAAALQHAGVIRYSRGRMIVTDRVGLESQSCSCYDVVRRVGENLYVNRAA